VLLTYVPFMNVNNAAISIYLVCPVGKMQDAKGIMLRELTSCRKE